jgi:hypothetical protein
VDTEATTLFMLSDHVRDALTVLARTSLLPADIQGRVNNTLSAAEEEVFEPEAEVAAAGQIVQGPKLERDDENEKDEEGEKDGNTSSDRIALAPPRVRRPPTVSADLLDEISAWAAQHDAELTSAGIGTSSPFILLTTPDSADFGLIALLAGTTVYLAPRQRALARVAERNAEEKVCTRPSPPSSSQADPSPTPTSRDTCRRTPPP